MIARLSACTKLPRMAPAAMLVALLAVVWLACPPSARALKQPGFQLPALTLPDADGKLHDLAALTKDKVALVVYWSVSCPHCRRELPHILELARPYEGNPFVLLFVNADPPAMAPAVKAYTEQHAMPGPVLMDVGPDGGVPLADALDIIATPCVAVVDSRGKVTFLQELKVDLGQAKTRIEEGF